MTRTTSFFYGNPKSALKTALRALGAVARRRPDNTVLGALHGMCRQFFIGFNNEIFDDRVNGELFMLGKLCSVHDLDLVFDVGANDGSWCRQLKKLVPTASVHCFEPLTETFESLRENTKDLSGVKVNQFGLMRRSEKRSVRFSPGRFYTATTADIVGGGSLSEATDSFSASETCEFRNPQNYVAEQAIKRIDFLKIDVEGADYDVAAAFHEADIEIPFIQFEYTVFSILNRVLLRDFFDLLCDEYDIYKIYPNWLEKVPYTWDSELNPAGNYLAIDRRVDVTGLPLKVLDSGV